MLSQRLCIKAVGTKRLGGGTIGWNALNTLDSHHTMCIRTPLQQGMNDTVTKTPDGGMII